MRPPAILRAALAAAAWVAAIPGALAQAPAIDGLGPRPPEIVSDLTPEAYAAAITARALEHFTLAYPGCAEAPRIASLFGAPYAERVDPADALLAIMRRGGNQVYWERLALSACGHEAIENVLAIRGRAFEAMTALPGSTRMSMGAYVNVQAHILAAAHSAFPNCGAQFPSDYLVVDTHLLTEGLDHAAWATPWEEQWIVRLCGADAPLSLHFTPTPARGGYSVAVRAAPGG